LLRKEPQLDVIRFLSTFEGCSAGRSEQVYVMVSTGKEDATLIDAQR